MKETGIAVWLALSGALALAACADRESAEARSPAEDRPSPVQVTRGRLGALTRTAMVSATVQPIRRVFVNSQMTGEVVAVRVEEGDAVREGALLAALDDRQLRAELASAQAAFEVAEAAVGRADRLRETRVITEAEHDRERAAYAAAAARLEQLLTQLEFAAIRAPRWGVVTERSVEVGHVVSPQTPLFTIADISTLVVRAGVSELDVVHLRPGTEVELRLDAFPERALEGRIRRVFPAADSASRLVPVEVALSGEAAELARPGFLARVSFPLETRDEVVLVPSAAVLTRGGGEIVFVVEEGRAGRRSVTTGLTSGDEVEIVAGLGPGEQVVVSGQAGLRDGMAVRVVEGPTGEVPTESAPEPGGTE